jgi:hypothetical protein
VVTNTATKTADVVSMKNIREKKTLNRSFFFARKGKRIRTILPEINSIFCPICTYSTVSVHRIEFKACSVFRFKNYFNNILLDLRGAGMTMASKYFCLLPLQNRRS